MTHVPRRRFASLVPLLALLLAMLSPAAALAIDDTGPDPCAWDPSLTADDDGCIAPAERGGEKADGRKTEGKDGKDGKKEDGKPGKGDGKDDDTGGDDKPGKGDGKPGDGKPGDGKPGDGKPGKGDGKPGDGTPEPCRMVESRVERGTAEFTIGPEGCKGKVGPVSFSTYKLPGGTVEPFDEQVLHAHSPDNGASYGEGTYTLSASIDDLCAWQSDLYRGDSQDHAPHDHFLDGMNVGWDYVEDKGCFKDDDGGPGDEPGELDVDLTVTPTGICLGDDVVITVRNDSDTAVTVTGTLTLPNGDTTTIDLPVDGDATATHTHRGAVVGIHTLAWSASADDHDTVTGTLAFTVVDCTPGPPDPGTPPDDEDPPVDEDDVPSVTLDYTLTCPEGAPFVAVTATGTDLDVTEGQLRVGADAVSAPVLVTPITLDDTVTVAWPIGADGLSHEQILIQVTFGGVTSPPMVLQVDELGSDCELVLDEDADQPDDGTPGDGDSDDGTPGDGGPDEGGPDVGGDDAAPGDEDGTPGDDDTVLGVSADQLPRTGIPVVGLLLAGLLALLTGAGLLRRRA